MQRIYGFKPRLVVPKSCVGFRAFSFSASRAISKLTEDHEHFFRYTSGRWLCNEEAELAQRYLRFDVENLKRVAGLTQQSQCTGIRKLEEGFHNKVFLMQFANGSEAIARLPSPVAGHPHWTVANEVATLEFVREVLGIPAPKVLKWSNQEIGQSGVGAEFMLMEHAPGRKLSIVWPSMEPEQRFAIVKGLIGIEKKLAVNALCKFGSIYLKHDCPEDSAGNHRMSSILQEGSDTTARFTIGRVPDKAFWPDEARDLKLDQGPWDTPLTYFTAIAQREIALLQISKHNTKHIELLQKFLAILPFILPAEQDISRPTLWHLDVHEDNVFVDDQDPTKITSIIDWQNVWAAPLFMQARFPSLVDCPHPYLMGLVAPTLPEDWDTLSDEEKAIEKHHLLEIKLKKFYEIGTRRLNPVAYKAMATMEDDNDPVATILRTISHTRKHGPIALQELLIQIYENWEAIVVKIGITSACPISFTENEISIARNSAEAWAVAFQEFESLRSDLLAKDGWVSHEEYGLAKVRYEAHKHELGRLKKKVDTVLDIN